MRNIEQPNAKTPLMLRPWVPWLLGGVLVTTGWALVDNVNDREWVLVWAFGAMTAGLMIQIVALLVIRRANSRTEVREARDHRR
ncbi:hypothetical protein OHA21_17535 [Actinoplanes sp. NBC_00393]|uniref:hypothetical protein n=1 Tax=Actinoplanes sp. NBC_00393 TaxID=2975953 RepID=UPI002E2412F6